MAETIRVSFSLDPPAPAGFTALPENEQLSLNLLPFRFAGGIAANLYYWDATGASVAFGDLPLNHSLFVTEAGGTHSFELGGTNTRVTDVLVGVTDDEEGMHEHLQFFLDDNDNNEETDPSTGFYMFAFELTMAGLQTSEPVFVALSSPEIPAAVENQVLQWMQVNLDNFVIGSIPGDFDGDGELDCADIDRLVAEIAAVPMIWPLIDGGRTSRHG